MRARRFGVLATSALLTVLAACADPPPPAGVVTDKEYDDPDTRTKTVCVKWSGGVCAKQSPVAETEPAEWTLCVRADNGKDECFEVNEDAYERYAVGDRYPGGE